MKLYAPKYYTQFKCIADKCKHSCCIGWEIDVDPKTERLYASLSSGYGKVVKESVDKNEAPHFALCDGDRCPHLDQSGLCRIITELGQEYLCDICREHPRFYNRIAQGMEVGLGAACEEACRIILESDEYTNIEHIGTTTANGRAPRVDFVLQRSRLYKLISESREYTELLDRIGAEFGVAPALKTEQEWRELIAQLEYLDPSHKEWFSCYYTGAQVPEQSEKYLKRALAYFIYRHCSAQRSETEFRCALGFCLFCERLLASLIANASLQTADQIGQALRVISEEIEYSTDNTEAIKLEFSFYI